MYGIDDDVCRQRIHVQRSNLVAETMRALKKKNFNEAKLLKVVFVGEPYADEGGPQR